MPVGSGRGRGCECVHAGGWVRRAPWLRGQGAADQAGPKLSTNFRTRTAVPGPSEATRQAINPATPRPPGPPTWSPSPSWSMWTRGVMTSAPGGRERRVRMLGAESGASGRRCCLLASSAWSCSEPPSDAADAGSGAARGASISIRDRCKAIIEWDCLAAGPKQNKCSSSF